MLFTGLELWIFILGRLCRKISKLAAPFTSNLIFNLFQISDFFSYEHFYVIYCKFWELDTDHDLLIDEKDLSKHDNHGEFVNLLVFKFMTRFVHVTSLLIVKLIHSWSLLACSIVIENCKEIVLRLCNKVKLKN